MLKCFMILPRGPLQKSANGWLKSENRAYQPLAPKRTKEKHLSGGNSVAYLSGFFRIKQKGLDAEVQKWLEELLREQFLFQICNHNAFDSYILIQAVKVVLYEEGAGWILFCGLSWWRCSLPA